MRCAILSRAGALRAGLLLCCVLCRVGPAQGAKAPLDIVLSNQEWPPYMGEALPYQGILSRLVQEAFARGGVRVHYRFYPNNRTLSLARSGAVDGSLGWAPNEDRKKDLLYTRPVLSARMVFFQHAGPTIRWRALEELSSFRIGVTLGNYYGAEFDQLTQSGKLKAESVGDDISNLRKVLAKRIDLFPIDEEVGNYLIQQNFTSHEASQFAVSGLPFWSAPLHVVIWRRHPRAPELVARFNQGLRELQDDGEFDRLLTQTRTACLAR
ncbi:transporter substrate-binding domain-containing protein [uncultured Aquitalea sp.]|uniref:substrate-binding periplasmic protein n=1 Tax=uncultured Aquitalea sp. TaxID=540272 RepID=UPI0025E2F216|nr:transporter substrate-binding domain-containing protein [uncultured Aquitalea sp.]